MTTYEKEEGHCQLLTLLTPRQLSVSLVEWRPAKPARNRTSDTDDNTINNTSSHLRILPSVREVSPLRYFVRECR